VTTNPNDPAFGHPYLSAETGEFTYTEPGLTKREYFAAAALQGMLGDHERNGTFADYARDALKFADALVEELSK
jgi:hypothetical protein